MIQYIYFVKCPNCEDEAFDFFDDAKSFATGCLSKQPIITQVEVDRNDFGECVDSCDLGTIWSWEDCISDILEEPELSILAKADTIGYDPDTDSEFNNLDNTLDSVPDNFRKPVPDGMTIEQLVEAMEENEDTVECVCCQELYPKKDCKYDEKHGWICPDCVDEVVECTWCEELYDRSQCRYEVDMGWLCDRCEAAIKSRGETLTFREGSYWDFLDESKSLSEAFRYLATSPDAKSLLVDKLKQYPELASYDLLGGNRPIYMLDNNSSNGMKNIGAITGFNIQSDGDIEVVYKDVNNGTTMYADIDDLLRLRLNRNRGGGYTFLRALKNAARDLDNDIKSQIGGVKGLRAENTLQELKVLPEAVLNDLLSKVSRIEFKVPLINVPGYDDEFSLARLSKQDQLETGMDTEPLSEEAIEKLETICDNFLNSRTGQIALDAGIVKNRPSDTDTNRNIINCWGAVGKVTFNCPVASLDQSVQDIIKASAIKKDGDDTSEETDINNKVKEVSSYRLASALVLLGALNINESLKEAVTNKDNDVVFDYSDERVTLTGHYYPGGYYSNGDPREPDWDEEEYTVDITYPVDRNTVEETLIELMGDSIIEEPLPEDLRKAFEGEVNMPWHEQVVLWDKYFAENFDMLVDKYYGLLKDHFKDDAIEYYEENNTIESEAEKYEPEFNWDY